MTDKNKLVRDIMDAITSLNLAITAAAKDGIMIEELTEIDSTKMDDKCRCIIYSPIIVHKEVFYPGHGSPL